jgi:hypothetical protein
LLTLLVWKEDILSRMFDGHAVHVRDARYERFVHPRGNVEHPAPAEDLLEVGARSRGDFVVKVEDAVFFVGGIGFEGENEAFIWLVDFDFCAGWNSILADELCGVEGRKGIGASLVWCLSEWEVDAHLPQRC